MRGQTSGRGGPVGGGCSEATFACLETQVLVAAGTAPAALPAELPGTGSTRAKAAIRGAAERLGCEVQVTGLWALHPAHRRLPIGDLS